MSSFPWHRLFLGLAFGIALSLCIGVLYLRAIWTPLLPDHVIEVRATVEPVAQEDGSVSLSREGSFPLFEVDTAWRTALDVERLLDRHPRVTRSAIVPTPDPIAGERAAAFIVPNGESELHLGLLCDYLMAEGIAKTKLPENLVVVQTMPLTATGKINKTQLKNSH